MEIMKLGNKFMTYVSKFMPGNKIIEDKMGFRLIRSYRTKSKIHSLQTFC